eukprot:3787708-Pyramimonas_sp.AAC.1
MALSEFEGWRSSSALAGAISNLLSPPPPSISATPPPNLSAAILKSMPAASLALCTLLEDRLEPSPKGH